MPKVTSIFLFNAWLFNLRGIPQTQKFFGKILNHPCVSKVSKKVAKRLARLNGQVMPLSLYVFLKDEHVIKMDEKHAIILIKIHIVRARRHKLAKSGNLKSPVK